MPPPQKILIIKLGALGDIVLTLNHIAHIRSQHPNNHISLLTRPHYAEFLKKCPHIDNIIRDPQPHFLNLIAQRKWHKQLKAQNFSLIYDLQQSPRSQRYCKNLTATIKGFDDKPIPPFPAIQNDWLKTDNINEFNLASPYVLLLPGCAPHRQQKQWDINNYGKLAKHLHQKNYQPVIIGSAFETNLAKQIKQHCPAAIDLTARTDIAQVASLAASAIGAIGNDSGPSYLAAYMGCASLILCGKASSSAINQSLFGNSKTSHSTILRTDNLQDLSVDKVAKSLPFG